MPLDPVADALRRVELDTFAHEMAERACGKCFVVAPELAEYLMRKERELTEARELAAHEADVAAVLQRALDEAREDARNAEKWFGVAVALAVALVLVLVIGAQ